METLDEKLREKSSDLINIISKLEDIAELKEITNNHDGFTIPRVYEINKSKIEINNYRISIDEKITINFYGETYNINKNSKLLAYDEGFIVVDVLGQVLSVCKEKNDEGSPLFAILPDKEKLYFLQFREV